MSLNKERSDPNLVINSFIYKQMVPDFNTFNSSLTIENSCKIWRIFQQVLTAKLIYIIKKFSCKEMDLSKHCRSYFFFILCLFFVVHNYTSMSAMILTFHLFLPWERIHSTDYSQYSCRPWSWLSRLQGEGCP